jgi:hypothetical protein
LAVDYIKDLQMQVKVSNPVSSLQISTRQALFGT